MLRRFLTVGRILLEDGEREYGISPITDKDYDYRVGAVRHAALNRAAEKLDIKFAPEEDAIHKIREIFTALDGITLSLSRLRIKLVIQL